MFNVEELRTSFTNKKRYPPENKVDGGDGLSLDDCAGMVAGADRAEFVYINQI